MSPNYPSGAVDGHPVSSPDEHRVAGHVVGNRAQIRKILRFGVGRGRKRRAAPAAPPLSIRINPAKPQVADSSPKQRRHRALPNLPRTVIFCTLGRFFRQHELNETNRRGIFATHANPPDTPNEKSGRGSQESSIFSQIKALWMKKMPAFPFLSNRELAKCNWHTQSSSLTTSPHPPPRCRRHHQPRNSLVEEAAADRTKRKQMRPNHSRRDKKDTAQPSKRCRYTTPAHNSRNGDSTCISPLTWPPFHSKTKKYEETTLVPKRPLQHPTPMPYNGPSGESRGLRAGEIRGYYAHQRRTGIP